MIAKLKKMFSIRKQKNSNNFLIIKGRGERKIVFRTWGGELLTIKIKLFQVGAGRIFSLHLHSSRLSHQFYQEEQH